MRVSLLLGYQWLTGLSDATAGVLLCAAPAFTLRLMGLHVPPDVGPYVSYIGAFVLSVGLACLYGVLLIVRRAPMEHLEVVWLLTAFTRSAVAIYVASAVVTGALDPGWLGVVAFDAACVVIQAIGLRKRWLANVQ